MLFRSCVRERGSLRESPGPASLGEGRQEWMCVSKCVCVSTEHNVCVHVSVGACAVCVCVCEGGSADVGVCVCQPTHVLMSRPSSRWKGEAGLGGGGGGGVSGSWHSIL